jgi:hypothetical protein
MNRTEHDHNGLFGFLYGTASIQNLGVTNAGGAGKKAHIAADQPTFAKGKKLYRPLLYQSTIYKPVFKSTGISLL